MQVLKSNLIFLLPILPLLFSCGKNEANVNEYNQFISDTTNGLTQRYVFDNYEFSMKYVPTDFSILMNENIELLDEKRLEILRSEQNNLLTFHFQVKPISGETDVLDYAENSIENHDTRLSYLISGIKNEIYLVSESDTFLCSMHHYERLYTAKAGHKLIFCFEVNDYDELLKSKSIRVILNDTHLGTGKLVYKFNTTNLKAIPILTI